MGIAAQHIPRRRSSRDPSRSRAQAEARGRREGEEGRQERGSGVADKRCKQSVYATQEWALSFRALSALPLRMGGMVWFLDGGWN